MNLFFHPISDPPYTLLLFVSDLTDPFTSVPLSRGLIFHLTDIEYIQYSSRVHSQNLEQLFMHTVLFLEGFQLN